MYGIVTTADYSRGLGDTCGMDRYSIQFIFSELKVFSVNQCVAKGADSVGLFNGSLDDLAHHCPLLP